MTVGKLFHVWLCSFYPSVNDCAVKSTCTFVSNTMLKSCTPTTSIVHIDPNRVTRKLKTVNALSSHAGSKHMVWVCLSIAFVLWQHLLKHGLCTSWQSANNMKVSTTKHEKQLFDNVNIMHVSCFSKTSFQVCMFSHSYIRKCSVNSS